MTGGIGASLPRKEDYRFLTGQGRYLDDIVVPGALHAHFLRSPHAHARIRSIDVAAARAAPGVVAVVTGREVAEWTTTLQHGAADRRPASGRIHDAADRQGAVHRRPGRLHRGDRPLSRRGRRRADRGGLRRAWRRAGHGSGAGAGRAARRREPAEQPRLASELHGGRSRRGVSPMPRWWSRRRSTSIARPTRRSRRAAAARSGTKAGATSPCTSAIRCRIPTAPSLRAGCASTRVRSP